MIMPSFQFDDGFAEPNPLVKMIQHLLPAATVGAGSGIMNIFAGRSLNRQREEFEKVMLVAKYKADERLQTRQHEHDREMSQYNAAVQLTLNYLAHEQQLELQGRQHQHDRSMQRSEHSHQDEMQSRDLAHREVMYLREAEERLALHYSNQYRDWETYS